MAVNTKSGNDTTKQTPVQILNQSFDQTSQTLVSQVLGYDPDTQTVNRVKVTPDGKMEVNASVTATGSDGAIVDGVSNTIKATVKDLTNSNPLTVAITDGNGDQITSFGGGTQYTEGDVDSTVTGTALMWKGSGNTLTSVSDTNPLPIRVTTSENGVVSTVNSSTATLTANSTFTGTSEDVLDVSMVIVNVKASHASATDGLVIEFSPDGTNWDNNDKYTIPATTGKTFTAQPAGKYMRVRYTNGGTNQTYFRLETILKYVSTKPSSHRVQDTISDDDDGELGLTVLKLRTAQDNYVSGTATAGGNFKVSIEEVNGTTDFATETTLSALNTKVVAVDTGAVVVSSSALPSGASTSAKQDTGNTSLATIASAVSGAEMQVDVVTMPTTTVQATDLDIRNLSSAQDSVTVTGTVSTGLTQPLTDTELRATPVPVSGTVTANATLAAETTKVIGTVNIAASQSVQLASGTNGIGKLTANSGVDIGDVDVLTVPTDPFGANADAASATGSISAKLRAIATALGVTALDLGSGTGGTRTLRYFQDTAQFVGGTGTDTSATQRVSLATNVALPAGTNAIGKVLPTDIDVTAHTNYARKYYTSAGAATDGIVWSPAAGKRWHVTSLYFQVSADCTVTFEDDKAGGDDPVLKGEYKAGSGIALTFDERYPFASGEDAADLLVTTSAGNIYVSVVGYEI